MQEKYILQSATYVNPTVMEILANNYYYTDYWFLRLFFNIFGYASIILPMWLLYRWLQNTGRLTRIGRTGLFQLLTCHSIYFFSVLAHSEPSSFSLSDKLLGIWFLGSKVKPVTPKIAPGEVDLEAGQVEKGEESKLKQVFLLLFCFLSLQVAYLTWGLLQEKIMTQKYFNLLTGEKENFKNSQFLVFLNRLFAASLSATVLLVKNDFSTTAPLYKFSFASISNILSAWCQYEALKFVTFPTQVLGTSVVKLGTGKMHQFHKFSCRKGLENYTSHANGKAGLQENVSTASVLHESFHQRWSRSVSAVSSQKRDKSSESHKFKRLNLNQRLSFVRQLHRKLAIGSVC